MTKSIPFALALAFVPAFGSVQEDKSYLGIFVETHVMQIAGVKPEPMPQMPPGFKLPASVMAMMPGKAHRILNVRLWSPSIAPSSATASIAPPEGLKLGSTLNLQLYRPTPAPTGGATGGRGGKGERKDLTVKIYWGSSETVQEGQPKIFSTANMTPEQGRAIGVRMQSMNPMGMRGRGAHGDYFYKDGWTTAYWPTDKEPGEIADDAALPGTYSLSTNYTGNVSIDAPSNVDFLAPIEMTAPDLGTKPNLADSLPFQWSVIPNALGLYASAFGFEEKTNTLIIWTSSEVYADELLNTNDFLQMAEVRDMVRRKLFMNGASSAVTIPAGIFKEADFAMFNMVGYGPGTAKDDTQPVPRIQTKTSLMLMLGGKKAR
ncbi:MAG: hypothetical protein JSS72_02580 [Armatimonadetes bacterium]|nr:hypothetical protein [Armatimonadota bacterium]